MLLPIAYKTEHTPIPILEEWLQADTNSVDQSKRTRGQETLESADKDNENIRKRLQTQVEYGGHDSSVQHAESAK